jgi:radical SAM superfamily enzyme YgiQ (UPF0313 family)
MKVAFLNPSRSGQGNIPLNIPLLIAVARAHGHEVRLFDLGDYACFDRESQAYAQLFFKEASLDEERVAAERRAFYGAAGLPTPGPAQLKTSDHAQDFRRFLLDFQPQVVAVSSMTIDFAFACDFLAPLKRELGFKVVVGGIHAILLPQEAYSHPAVDFLCVGEGENALPQLLKALEQGDSPAAIPGLWGKWGGGEFRNGPAPLTDLASLPAPDFSLYDPIHFFRPFDGQRYKMLNYELSRGCPFNCTYCVNGVLKQNYRGLGSYHRVKRVEQSIAELKHLVERYGFDFIRFWDESFTALRTDYLERYAAAYVEHIGLPFLIYARAESVSEDKVRILKDMGCRTFAMGIESGNPRIRREVMNRHMSDNTIIKAFHLVAKYGIRTSAYNIIGLPREDRAAIFDTIALNRAAAPSSFSVTLLEPYKGTPIRQMCEDEGLDPAYEVSDIARVHFTPRSLSEAELKGLFRAFPLYVKMSQDRWPEIARAEQDDQVYQGLMAEYSRLK